MINALRSINMKVYQGIEKYQPPAGEIVLTVGNFDGVHLGHRRLVDAARAKARDLNASVVALTFEPHPLAIVAPQRTPARLTTLSEKIALLEALGVDAAIVMHSTRELLDKTAEQFLSELVESCGPRVIIEGPTFNFGRGRGGSAETLRRCAPRFNFDVTVVEELHSDELADNPAINSSAIRRALRDGRLSDANTMLGRPHRITGTVTTGEHRGVTLGFPTANLAEIPQLLPRQAVYIAVAQLADDTLHLAAVNVGPQPTFGQTQPCVEAFLLNYSGELHGQPLGLHFFNKIRDQVRFSSSDGLVAQLHRDVEQARTYASRLDEMQSKPRLPL